MTGPWSTEELELLDRSEELQITTRRGDRTLRPWVPIWVVCVDGHAYVRTWQRRDNGWFGRAVSSRRAWIRVPGLECEVAVEDVGGGARAELSAAVDASYRSKYGRYGSATVDRMTGEDAAATTLRLVPTVV